VLVRRRKVAVRVDEIALIVWDWCQITALAVEVSYVDIEQSAEPDHGVGVWLAAPDLPCANCLTALTYGIAYVFNT